MQRERWREREREVDFYSLHGEKLVRERGVMCAKLMGGRTSFNFAGEARNHQTSLGF